MLVDDHAIVRFGFATVLGMEADLEIAAEAESGAHALVQYRRFKPDVVLLDLRMPGGLDGLEVLHQLREEWPDARVIILTTSALDDDVQRAMDHGARGYLLKSVQRKELISAIRSVHRGGVCLPEALASRLAQYSAHPPLSEREAKVLDLLRRGLSNREIGIALIISERTAKAHVAAILVKLQAADRAEAVGTAYAMGLLRVESV
jgi:DNA-binding NarL/FixJ family response regulator